MSGQSARKQLRLQPQPDEFSCGATCLHAIYDYWGRPEPLERVVADVPQLESGGTLGVHLAVDALHRGFSAEIHSYNLDVFDPTWFRGRVDLDSVLRQRAGRVAGARVREACEGYRTFLSLGGRLHYEDLTVELIRGLLADGPVVAGLSATYLYGAARETSEGVADPIGGEPVGHFVVLLDTDSDGATVADPYTDDPAAGSRRYSVPALRLVAAILLGVITYDANLIRIRPGNAAT